MNNEKKIFNVVTFVKEILMSLKEIIWISRTQHSVGKDRIWEYWYSLIDTCGLCWRGRVSQAGYVIASHNILWVAVACPCSGCLHLVAKSSHIMYIYIINIYSCTSIIVWECILMCMCMVTSLSMRFCVFICVYMYVFTQLYFYWLLVLLVLVDYVLLFSVNLLCKFWNKTTWTWTRKWVWKCCLQNGRHFVSASQSVNIFIQISLDLFLNGLNVK